ncbi:Vps51/Vps67-domain-containing protein [Kalaharituber pfeilii]|nr:Vps51/Vps67-domain-containing protein [Kalaharituber pfeilii]
MSNPTISIDSTHLTTPSTPTFPSSASPSAPASPNPNSTTLGRPPPLRSSGKNRNALRQFYGLKKDGETVVPEIDREGFDADAYVKNLCKTADLRELLRAENELVNEIRGFDGERKALVYDNYSKLISATDTIKKMRASMEPLTPTTSTLEPAISHIAQISSLLTETIHKLSSADSHATSVPIQSPPSDNLKAKRETVRWALGAPDRICALVQEGKKEQAQEEWNVVVKMLDKWGDGVKGVKELREKGEKALQGR